MRLSKSRYLAGLQCSKRLYLEIHAPTLATEPDEQRRAMMTMGQEIGESARRCFPGGVLVEEGYRQTPAALDRTMALLQDSSVPAIFEGAFQYDGTLVRVDILERAGEQSWKLIEVKAASRIKAVHIDDLAVQAFVLKGLGLNLVSINLMYVNRHYVYAGGVVDYHQLFCIQDLTDSVTAKLPAIESKLDQLRSVLAASSPPRVEPDDHCQTPYPCPFWDHCTRAKSDRWIFHLPGEKHLFHQLTTQGIETIDEIPPSIQLTVLQRRVKDNREWVSPDVRRVLDSVEYPVHHLDFETFMPAIPLYSGTHPYQPLPVQWSNHVEFADSTLHHDFFLCRDEKDPREELAVRLLESLGDSGTICVYSDYERFVLQSLAEAVPRLKKELHGLLKRLWDLLAVIQRHYYHPEFKGSFSMKSVLPAMVPSLSYDDLTVQDGASASAIYHRMVFQETDWVERDALAQTLLAYCARDTLGMVEIRRALWRKVNAHEPRI